ncbi:MAG: ARPP-1 family domain-containing protein [Thermoplasmata archaeon]
MKAFVESILREEEGFSFGDPWSYKNSKGTILPIRRKGRRRRKYRTLEEVLKDTKDAVEVTETGSIRKVKILNRTDIPIFVRMGTIFAGKGTQSRAAEGSVILVPHTKARPLEVCCVEAAVPIRGGTRFDVAGFTAPHSVEMGLYSHDQEEVWERVSSYARTRTAPGRRSRRGRESSAVMYRLAREHSLVDIVAAVETFKEQVDEVLEVVPNYEDQAGLVFLDQKGVLGMEAFDMPKSWEAVSERIVKKYGDVISIPTGEEPIPSELDKDAIVGQAHRFLQALAVARGRVTFKESGHQTFALTGKSLVGEYTTIDGDVMHLTGVRFERKPKKKGRMWPGDHPPRYTREELEREVPRARRDTHGRDREEGVREGP